MGLFKKLRDAGQRVLGGVTKVLGRVAPIVQGIAPIVQGIASSIPHPAAQAIGKGAGFLGAAANQFQQSGGRGMVQGLVNRFNTPRVDSPRIGLRNFGR